MENKNFLLFSYCTVLRKACQAFTRAIKDVFGGQYNAFAFLTLPSLTNYILRSKYLGPNDLAVFPPNGYNVGRRRQSFIAMEWMEDLSQRLGTRVNHLGNCISEEKVRCNFFGACVVQNAVVL